VDAADACNVKVFGNAFPGGVAEARIRTAVCPSSVSGAMSDVLRQRSSLRRSTRVGGVAHRRSFGVAGT
jgi:hypothetical protein